MGKVALKLNGKPLDLTPKSSRVDALKAFLDAAPIDEIFDSATLSKIARVSSSAMHDAKERLAIYSLLLGRNRYWGHPKAIAELKRQTA
jgi:hypothetical protein